MRIVQVSRTFTLTKGPGEAWATFGWFVQAVTIETAEAHCDGTPIFPAWNMYFWEAFGVAPAAMAGGGNSFEWTDNWGMPDFCDDYAIGSSECCIQGKGLFRGTLYFYNVGLRPPAGVLPPMPPFADGGGSDPWFGGGGFGFYEYPLSADAGGTISPALAAATFSEVLTFQWKCCGSKNDTEFP